MKKILVLIGRYLPGYKDGGPIRTWINVTEALGDEYEFRIVTLDRDRGDDHPYPGIRYNEWNRVGKAGVWYVKRFSMKLIRQLAQEANMVYSCGFYDHYGYSTLLLNRLGLLYGKPLVVAPMGTFSQGAMAQKSLKKKIFIDMLQLLGLFRNVRWSVTSQMEAAELCRYIKGDPECLIAEDLPRINVMGCSAVRKELCELRVIFLSRISPMKNLQGAIEILRNVKKPVSFSIYGPTEDMAYWQRCQKLLQSLPENISWSYNGIVHTDDVQKVFQDYDVFLFPTLGENYGHVIFEALSAGCIPVISDQTPWQSVSDCNAGFVLPLSDLSGFVEAIDNLAEMEETRLCEMSNNAVALAQEKVSKSMKETGYRIIFG